MAGIPLESLTFKVVRGMPKLATRGRIEKYDGRPVSAFGLPFLESRLSFQVKGRCS